VWLKAITCVAVGRGFAISKSLSIDTPLNLMPSLDQVAQWRSPS
jgi:hypothetical protein